MKILYLCAIIYCLEDYIVLFEDRTNLNNLQRILNRENNLIKTKKLLSSKSKIKHEFLNGFYGEMDEEKKKKQEKEEEIAVIEKDSVVKIANYKVMDIFLDAGNLHHERKESTIPLALQERAPWGLSRVLGKSYVKSRQYIYPEDAGKDVEVFVIDTGINVLHPDFQGRARWGANFVGGSLDTDDNGHGTHVAGVIGGFKYGISKKANIVAVKVLDANGVGMISKILKGIDYVINEHEKKRELLYDIASAKYLGKKRTPNLEKNLEEFINESNLQPKTVVNMSVGGTKSVALNFALDYAASLGIHFAVAAGNDQQNACSYSPGSSKHAVTIGATDMQDKTADFSNFGNCVDLYAPGVNILSAWNDRRWRIVSGTSMACPHVAGVMALYLGLAGFTPEALKNRLIKDAKNVISADNANESIFKAMWPLNWFSDKEKLPLVSTNKLIKKIIDKNNK